MPHDELARLELLAAVDRLVDRMNGWVDRAPHWMPAEACRALVRRLAERAAALRVRVDAPLVVATLGGTGTGKSSLVNAIVGAEVAQTGRSRPTTLRPVVISRSDVTPEMLGIERASVEWRPRDLPALHDMVLVDCPDPDTTEASEAAVAATNLARLRAILPKCDVLLVTSTQQKYRSVRVADELAAAAPGARLVFLQTHADTDDDIRDDWRKMLEKWGNKGERETGDRPPLVSSPQFPFSIFYVDLPRVLADSLAGRSPQPEFAGLMDLLIRQMAGAAGHRIRRANFLELTAETLQACRRKIEPAMPAVRELQNAVDEQRGRIAAQLADRMQAELVANRRSWENRLLARAAARWGLSPFSLVLRVYQGLGGLVSGALLYRARTPAQVAIWGAMEGARTWRSHQKQRTTVGLSVEGFDSAELRKATVIVEGHLADAGFDRAAGQWNTVAPEAEASARGFVGRVAGELDALVGRLAERHTGWFTRLRYELLLLAMLGLVLYRLGKNFFYDSWLAEPVRPVFGLEFYTSAGFWLILWCLVLLWMFCRRLRRGLREEIARLATGWQDAASGVFLQVEDENRAAQRMVVELDAIRDEVESLQRQIA
ncbi:MAG: GTPase [Thermoguttaceae bacterium]